ncbi:hypothetical protein Goklo_029715, partial [Gossypium klotzschianum]|nr:hypothetical protein [Gossypium klotzschianum]
WKTWKKLKGEDIDLGWNLIKRIVDAFDDWWEKTSGIDPNFERKLDQMFMGIVATSDKAWAPSSGTLPSEFFEDIDNNILEENEEENVINYVHIDENNQKRKTNDGGTSHFKIRRKKSSKQIGGTATLSSQIENLCNAADNMS